MEIKSKGTPRSNHSLRSGDASEGGKGSTHSEHVISKSVLNEQNVRSGNKVGSVSSRSRTGSRGSRSTHSSQLSKTSSKKAAINKAEQQAAEMSMFSKDELAELKQVFNFWDKDSEGHITTRELGIVLRSLRQSPTDAELQDIINEADACGNGELTFQDFIHLMIKRKTSIDTEDLLVEAFTVFDKDNDGNISASELRNVMSKMGDQMTDDEIEDLIHETDRDGDGQIDYSEFLKMMLFK